MNEQYSDHMPGRTYQTVTVKNLDMDDGNMNGWQPILTAPMRKMVILWCPWMHKVAIGALGGRHDPNKWRIRTDMSAQWIVTDGEPTHWMPLPNPPEAT